MTELMKVLIRRLADIPEEKQDEYAAVYLAELEDDQRWEELFDRTTDEQWEAMIAEALEEAGREELVPLDEVMDTT